MQLRFQMKITAILSLLLVGCATTSVPRKPTHPPLPPLPPTLKVRFAPAAVVVANPDLMIYPFGPYYYLIVARQCAGCTLQMDWADTIPGLWHLLARYGYTTGEQYVSAQIPSDWQPYSRMFVRAINTPVNSSLTLASKPTTETYTNHKLTIKGQVYRLVETTTPGAQFKTYRLIK